MVFDLREEAAFGTGQDVSVLPSVEEAITAGDPAVTVGGRKLVSLMSAALADWKTVHHGHVPIDRNRRHR